MGFIEQAEAATARRIRSGPMREPNERACVSALMRWTQTAEIILAKGVPLLGCSATCCVMLWAGDPFSTPAAPSRNGGPQLGVAPGPRRLRLH